MVILTCPSCGGRAEVRDQLLGRAVSCPACGKSFQAPGARWFVARGRVKVGPYTREQLGHFAVSGDLQPTDMVLPEGGRTWGAAASLPGFSPAWRAQPVEGLPPPRRVRGAARAGSPAHAGRAALAVAAAAVFLSLFPGLRVLGIVLGCAGLLAGAAAAALARRRGGGLALPAAACFLGALALGMGLSRNRPEPGQGAVGPLARTGNEATPTGKPVRSPAVGGPRPGAGKPAEIPKDPGGAPAEPIRPAPQPTPARPAAGGGGPGQPAAQGADEDPFGSTGFGTGPAEGEMERHSRAQAEAVRGLEQHLEKTRKLYPPDRYPRGHLDLAASLYSLGDRLLTQGQYEQARHRLEEALAMLRRLLPPDRSSDGSVYLAATLADLGELLRRQAEYGQAREYLEEAVARFRALYPPARYPQGETRLAGALNSLGRLYRDRAEYEKSRPLLEEALAMRRKLYPRDRHPQGHSDLAQSLTALGGLARDEAAYPEADRLLEEGQDMHLALFSTGEWANRPDSAENLAEAVRLARVWRGKVVALYGAGLALGQRKGWLYPRDRFPRGHPDIAASYDLLGLAQQDAGESSKALGSFRRAVVMCRALFPGGRPPHPVFVRSLADLGRLLGERGEYDEAARCLEEGVALARRLYPPDQYPRGHPDLARCLVFLGELRRARGDLAGARPALEEAAAMYEKVFPADRFPHGHPRLAGALVSLGGLLRDGAEFAESRRRLERAAAVYRHFFPRGHLLVARCLHELALACEAGGDPARAVALAEESLALGRRLLNEFAAGKAEAEVLNYLGRLPDSSQVLLSASARPGVPPDRVYGELWRAKAAVARLFGHRQEIVRGTTDPRVPSFVHQLRAVRRLLARNLLSPPRPAPAPGARRWLTVGPGGLEPAKLTPKLRAVLERQRQDQDDKVSGVNAFFDPDDLVNLIAWKEFLEGRLTLFAANSDRRGPDPRGPADLARLLPPHSAFVDFFRYSRPVKGGGPPEMHYAAFVVRPGRPVGRVEVGPAAPVDRAVAEWRQKITGGGPGDAAATLRRLLWEPLTAQVPADTETVWLCPEGPLTALPWAALPGAQPGTLLLEQCALATVPHGPFLLDELGGAAHATPRAEAVLVVGGVDYDAAPPGGAGAAPAEAGRLNWAALPGTDRERARVEGLARADLHAQVVDLHGPAADADRLLGVLPRVRWAHLATHGFFADKAFRSALRADEAQFRRDRDRGSAGARSPLVLSGLVLAGANRPGGDPGRGLVTAEDIVELNLSGLELATLSACETGLGEVAGGEGVFGLQRAFHLAGCKNVVASLWQVDDEATAALMTLFYTNLWQKKLPPREALRQAQLFLYRHPRQVPQLARRGFRPDQPAGTSPPEGAGRAPVRQWAAFTLSGAGR